VADDGEARRSDYRAARIAAALVLIGAVALSVAVDALGGKDASPIVLGALLGTSAGLLGVELVDIPRIGRR